VSKSTRPRPVSGFLSAALSGTDLAGQVERLRDLQRRWAGLLPPDLAARTRPAALSGGRLTVLAASAAWATRLRHQRTAILGLLRRDPQLSAVRELRILVAPAEAATSDPRPRRPD